MSLSQVFCNTKNIQQQKNQKIKIIWKREKCDRLVFHRTSHMYGSILFICSIVFRGVAAMVLNAKKFIHIYCIAISVSSFLVNEQWVRWNSISLHSEHILNRILSRPAYEGDNGIEAYLINRPILLFNFRIMEKIK